MDYDSDEIVFTTVEFIEELARERNTYRVLTWISIGLCLWMCFG